MLVAGGETILSAPLRFYAVFNHIINFISVPVSPKSIICIELGMFEGLNKPILWKLGPLVFGIGSAPLGIVKGE